MSLHKNAALQEDAESFWRHVRGSMDINKPSTYVSDGSVDYRGEPAELGKTGGWRAAPLILGSEMCERLATNGISLNLETYLVNDIHFSISRSSNIVTNFMGTSYILCLLGGIVADAFLGRFQTIRAATAIQFLGMTMLTLSASLPSLKPEKCLAAPCGVAHGIKLVALFLGLYLVALGTGGIKSCVSSFGADQFDDGVPEELEKKAHYFNWFFFFISLGTLMAATIFVYVQVTLGRGWGFGFSAGTMVFAMCAFWAGAPLYRYQHPQGSPLTAIAHVFVAAVRNQGRAVPSHPNMLYEIREEDRANQAKHFETMKHTDQFRCLDKAAITPQTQEEYSRVSPWKLCTVTQVEEVKQVLRMVPIWATTTLCYTVYAQMLTFTVEQGQTLDRRISADLTIPPASLGVFLQLGVMLSVTFYDLAFVPLAKRLTGLNKGITTLQRMGTGLLLSVLAMIAAALVETKRVHRARSVLGSEIPMSVFWLVPQYFLVGASEAFTYVGQLDFFYYEAPWGMRSMATGLCLSTVSIGYFTSSFLVESVNKFTKSDTHPGWLEGNFNKSKLGNFYWILAILSATNMLLFLLCASWYKYKPMRHGSADETPTKEAPKTQTRT